MNNSSETIHVYLDCDWMDVPQFVGCLYREVLRGTAKYAFEFDREWLKKHANVKLSADCAKLSKWNGNSLKTEQVRFGLPFGSDLGESLAFLLLGGGRNQLRP